MQESIPATELNLCDNSAIDGVAGHYCLRYKENSIPFSIKLDLPYELPISEMDMCLVLSNLLENALEASLRTNKAKRYVKIESYIHSNNVVLLTVENAFDGTATKKNGVFQSSKRRGDGVGIQSVRRIAEKRRRLLPLHGRKRSILRKCYAQRRKQELIFDYIITILIKHFQLAVILFFFRCYDILFAEVVVWNFVY